MLLTDLDFFRYIHRRGALDQMVIVILVFWVNYLYSSYTNVHSQQWSIMVLLSPPFSSIFTAEIIPQRLEGKQVSLIKLASCLCQNLHQVINKEEKHLSSAHSAYTSEDHRGDTNSQLEGATWDQNS